MTFFWESLFGIRTGAQENAFSRDCTILGNWKDSTKANEPASLLQWITQLFDLWLVWRNVHPTKTIKNPCDRIKPCWNSLANVFQKSLHHTARCNLFHWSTYPSCSIILIILAEANQLFCLFSDCNVIMEDWNCEALNFQVWWMNRVLAFNVCPLEKRAKWQTLFFFFLSCIHTSILPWAGLCVVLLVHLDHSWSKCVKQLQL